MKAFLLCMLGVVVCAVPARAEDAFSRRLTAEQLRSAGLDQLTPAQLAALDALVRADRVQGVAQQKEKTRAELRAEVKAEVKAEATQQARVEVRKEMQQERENETRILGKIVGKFSGWEGATQFKLENGQVWRQNEPGVYYTKPVDSPAVLIEKVYGSWRLYAQDGGWVRVVRIK